MHYLLCQEREKERKQARKKGFRSVFTIIAARSQNKTEERKKSLVHVLRSLSACARRSYIFYVSQFSSLLPSLSSIFSVASTRVIVELARASSALRKGRR
jgi:hypothetical protein